MIGAFVQMISTVQPVIDYIDRATETGEELFMHIKWIHSFIKAVKECLQISASDLDADWSTDIAHVDFPDQPATSNNRKLELFGTAHQLSAADLQMYLSKWSYHQGKYYFTRPGHDSQEVTIEPQIAATMTRHSEARRVFEQAASGFTDCAVSLELL